MVGEKGEGFKIAMAQLDQGRIGIAAHAVGKLLYWKVMRNLNILMFYLNVLFIDLQKELRYVPILKFKSY